jgi:hypothetical protein
MAYIGRPLQVANLAVQSGTGDGSDTTPIATLDYATTTNGIAVYLDGVRQLAGTDFNVTAQTTLTFTTAPANGVGVDVYFLGLELSLPTPADATVAKAKITTTLINEHVDTTITAADSILFSDATDSNANKKDTVQGILDLVPAGITMASTVATTSGTTIDFTGIPSGTKSIEVILSNVSTNGSGVYAIQIGDSGGLETSGYLGNVTLHSNSTPVSADATDGFRLTHANLAGATHSITGFLSLRLVNASTHTWVGTGQSTNMLSGAVSGYSLNSTASGKSLSAELTQVRLLNTSGNTWDAGEATIQYF